MAIPEAADFCIEFIIQFVNFLWSYFGGAISATVKVFFFVFFLILLPITLIFLLCGCIFSPLPDAFIDTNKQYVGISSHIMNEIPPSSRLRTHHLLIGYDSLKEIEESDLKRSMTVICNIESLTAYKKKLLDEYGIVDKPFNKRINGYTNGLNVNKTLENSDNTQKQIITRETVIMTTPGSNKKDN